MKHFKKGFTLIEMLIVTAIISVLAAVILPVIATAREHGRISSCSNNLHQISLAIAAYAQDNDQQTPLRVQNLWDAHLITDKQILICPDDTTGNWGGLVYEQARLLSYPGTPPETVKHSYIYAFTEELHPEIIWKRLVAADSDPGIVVCQLHGSETPFSQMGTPNNIGFYEGKILRLRIDGSVTSRTISWNTRKTNTDGGWAQTTDEWKLYSDTPSPSP